MKQQENNFEYKNILNVGFWEKNIRDLNTEPLINTLYKISQTTTSKTVSNKGGYHSPTNLNIFPQFLPLVKILNEEVFKLTQDPNYRIKEMWGNISYPTNFNSLHTHDKYLNTLSGVLYLKTPINGGGIIFHNPLDISSGHIFNPKEKDLVIFPSILPHLVEPNLSQEDRISIAFNFE